MLHFPCSFCLLRKGVITADRISVGDWKAEWVEGEGVVFGDLPELISPFPCLPAFPVTLNRLHLCLYAAKVVPQQITHTSPRIQSDYTAERSNLIPLSSHRASPNPVAMETRNDNRWGNSSSRNESV